MSLHITRINPVMIKMLNSFVDMVLLLLNCGNFFHDKCVDQCTQASSDVSDLSGPADSGVFGFGSAGRWPRRARIAAGVGNGNGMYVISERSVLDV